MKEAAEVITLMIGCGVFAGGFGILKWGLTTERRLLTLEVKTGIKR